MEISTASIPFNEASAASNKTLSIHRWTNWIAGFSGDFVQSVIKQYLPSPKREDIILDPFAGVGTTLVEAYRRGINSVGFEINPFAALVSQVKLHSEDVNIQDLQKAVYNYSEYMCSFELEKSIPFPAPRSVAPLGFLSRIPFFSKTIESKVLYTLDYIQELSPLLKDIFKVALGSVLVEFSNYTYEPSLGSRPGAGKTLIDTAPVGEIIGKKLKHMIEDIALLRQETKEQKYLPFQKIYCKSYFRIVTLC